MMRDLLSLNELYRWLGDPDAAEALSTVSAGAHPYVLVDLRQRTVVTPPPFAQPTCVVIGIGADTAEAAPDVVDVLATSELALDGLCEAIQLNPVAAAVLVQVLRHNARASVADGLLAESLAYSTLQHGAEFGRWLRNRGALTNRRDDPSEPILLQSIGDTLRISLNRPEKRNAFSAAMRDALCAALELPVYDSTIREIVVDGAGPAFCAGGDLDEFGDARDAAIAHATRMTRSAGALLHRLRSRVTCHIHGACIGAGIELPAFARRIRARPDAFIQLPEVSMGLVPGAGGTVSITKRIGRLRTAALALSGERIDAATALRWGLVDEIVERFD
jgi:enoyl-CoA hydratase/carnithine racemase